MILYCTCMLSFELTICFVNISIVRATSECIYNFSLMKIKKQLCNVKEKYFAEYMKEICINKQINTDCTHANHSFNFSDPWYCPTNIPTEFCTINKRPDSFCHSRLAATKCVIPLSQPIVSSGFISSANPDRCCHSQCTTNILLGFSSHHMRHTIATNNILLGFYCSGQPRQALPLPSRN